MRERQKCSPKSCLFCKFSPLFLIRFPSQMAMLEHIFDLPFTKLCNTVDPITLRFLRPIVLMELFGMNLILSLMNNCARKLHSNLILLHEPQLKYTVSTRTFVGLLYSFTNLPSGSDAVLAIEVICSLVCRNSIDRV